MFQPGRVRTTVFWVNAVGGALCVVAAVFTNMPAFLVGALSWLVYAVFWRSLLPLADFVDVLARRMNVAIIAVLLVAIVGASAAEMANTSRAVANLALSAAVLGFVLRLWRECSKY